MAIPAWRNIAAPNFSGANQLLASSSNQIGDSVNQLADAFNQYQQGTIDATAERTKQNTDSAIASLMRATSTSDLNALTGDNGALSQAALQQDYGSELDPARLAAAWSQQNKDLTATETDASRYADTLAQQARVNNRADTGLDYESQRIENTRLSNAETQRANLAREEQARNNLDFDILKEENDNKPAVGINPTTGKSYKDTENKAYGFSTRAEDATARIDSLIDDGFDSASFINQALTGDNAVVNTVAGAVDPRIQQQKQASEDWIAAVLRLESGAAIPEKELERYQRTYFPQIGDDENTVKQKRDARKSQERSLRGRAGEGRSYNSTLDATPPASNNAAVQVNGSNLQFNGSDVSESEVTDLMNRYGLDRNQVLQRLGG